jgi:hypothetical protein
VLRNLENARRSCTNYSRGSVNLSCVVRCNHRLSKQKPDVKTNSNYHVKSHLTSESTSNPNSNPTPTPKATLLPVAKPSVPEFTVAPVDRSYDVPVSVTYSTDPFTGQQVAHTSDGYHVTNRTIEITINNQQFTPITLNNGTKIQLYYSLQMKGHFGDWSDKLNQRLYFHKDGSSYLLHSNYPATRFRIL